MEPLRSIVPPSSTMAWADTLIGDGSLDWSLTGARDKIKDRSRNEQVN